MSEKDILLWVSDDKNKYKLRAALREHPYLAGASDFQVSFS